MKGHITTSVFLYIVIGVIFIFCQIGLIAVSRNVMSIPFLSTICKKSELFFQHELIELYNVQNTIIIHDKILLRNDKEL